MSTEGERQPRWRRKSNCKKYCRDVSCTGSALLLAIEETRAKTSEPESVLILSPVTMRLERGGAMVKNGKGIGKPNSFLKVSSRSAVLEERECESDRRNIRQKSDSIRVRCSSHGDSWIESRDSDVLKSGLALPEKPHRLVTEKDEDGQGLAGSVTESFGDGAMIDADPVAVVDGNKREKKGHEVKETPTREELVFRGRNKKVHDLEDDFEERSVR